jgi:hypothetical protein
LITRQHGPFRRDQLPKIGMSQGQIEYAIRIRRFHEIYPEVYVLGNRELSELGSLSAAVLACGEGSALGFRSAGTVRGMVKGYRGDIEILVPRHNPPRLDGIDARTTTFHPFEVGSVHGISTTSVARTYFDLAKVLDRKALVRAFELGKKQGLNARQLERILRNHKGERGTVAVRGILERQARYEGFSNGGFEDAFYEWYLTLRLATKPKRNANVRLKDGTTRQVDLLFGKLIVELYHYDHHGGDRLQTAFDHKRERALREVGYQVEVFTSDEFLDDRDWVEREVRRLVGS